MGLLAREIEACGVTTVALSLMRELSAPVKAPRMLFLHWPFGHVLGEPHNHAQQETVLHDAFSMARLAPHAGLVVELPYQWRRQVYTPVTDWADPGQAFTEGLAHALQAQEAIRT